MSEMNETTVKTEEEKCPRCEMQRLMVGSAVAHVACSTIEPDEERGECMAWAEELDLSKMSALEVMEGAYDRAGIQGLAAFPDIHNEMIKALIIKKVGQKLEKGEEVTTEEQDMYNKYTKESVSKGI